MKTVSGKLLSIQPISLSKAAKLISIFTASDNEASPAFSAYLKRTSAAFNVLVKLHKENINPSGESRNSKDPSSYFTNLGTPKSSKVSDAGLSIIKDTGYLKVSQGNAVSSKSKKNKDHPTGEHDVIIEIGNREETNKILPDVSGGVGKKPKKNTGSDVRCDGEQDTIHVSEGKSKMGNPNPIQEMKNDKKLSKKRGTDEHVAAVDDDRSLDAVNINGESKKKKKKIDKLGKENPDVGIETVQEVQHRSHGPDDGVGEAVDTVRNIRDERKKHKKNKVEEVKETERKDDGNVMKEGSEGKKGGE